MARAHTRSITAPDPLPHPYHSTQIHDDNASLAALVARMVIEAQRLSQPALVISSEPVLSMIARELKRRHVDVESLQDTSQLVMLDAAPMLQGLLVGGLPDASRFDARVLPLFERMCGAAELCIPMIYSDMADLLVRAGNTAAAVSLEILWNRLAATRAFTLLCGYAAADLHQRVPTLEELQAICEQHNTIQRRLD